jgi:amino acid adenylation domain-containing protein
MPYVYRFEGQVSIENLEKSQNAMIRRHEILRVAFPEIDGDPTPVIRDELELPIILIDITHLEGEEQEKQAQIIANEESCYSFDLQNGPLIRLSLIRLAQDHHILVINFHRIVCDGSSTGIFFHEFLKFYRAFCENKTPSLPDLEIQYLDYAHWSNKFSEDELLEEKLSYWKKQLGTNLPVLNLPTDYPRPPLTTYDAKRTYIMIPPEINEALLSLSRQSNCTLFMTLIAGLNILLSRYTRQNDLLLSFSHSGRGKVELEMLVGNFSKTLPIRTVLSEDLTFLQLLEQIREKALGADANYNISFDTLMEQFPLSGNPKRSPFVQLIFALNPPWRGEQSLSVINLPNLKISSIFGYVFIGKTKFDLGLIMRDTELGLRAIFEYNSSLFDGKSISKMLICFQTLLTDIVKNPQKKISEYSLITEEEKQQLVFDWNQTELKLNIKDNIVQQWENVVTKIPDQIALITNQEKLTYKELNALGNQLAHYLKSLGVTNGTNVAISLDRNSLMAVGILGILKAGGVVIPVEGNDSLVRQESVLKNAQVSVLLTVDKYRNNFDDFNLKLVSLDGDHDVITNQKTDNLDQEIKPNDPAWISYLINQEGKPEGVIISHQNILAQSQAIAHQLKLQPQEKIFHLAYLPFGNIIEALFPALFNGLTLVLTTEKEINSPAQLCEIINQEKINILNLPTAFWHQLVTDINLIKGKLNPELRLIMIGGEKLSPSSYETWIEEIGVHPVLLNSYGTNQTTMTNLVYEPKPFENKDKLPLSIPIGRPLPNTKVYILDENKLPVPISVPGELYVSGAGIGMEFYGEENSEKFIINPFIPDSQEKLYATGDLARYLPDGNIEFRGRIDSQIKINSVVVHPEEIELVLQNHPQISQSAVILQEDLQLIYTDKELVAYIVPKSAQTLTQEEITTYLKQYLPSYLIPSNIVLIESLPMLDNGQVDRHSLEALKAMERKLERAFVAPRNDIEIKLAAIWHDILDLEQVGIYDNFFDMGGNSVLSIQTVARISKVFNITFTLKDLFRMPTIAELAQRVEVLTQSSKNPINDLMAEESDGGRFPVNIRPLRPQGLSFPLYFIQIEQESFLNPIKKYLDPKYPIYSISNLGEIMAGLLANKFESFDATGTSVESLATQYVEALLKFQPKGPYCLLGISFGGLVAYEMARQMETMGIKVDNVILLDTSNPLSLVTGRTKRRILRHLTGLIKMGPVYLLQRIPWQVSRLKYWLSKKYDKFFGKKLFDLTPLIIHDILKYHNQLRSVYFPEKYNGKLTVIRAKEGNLPFMDIWAKLTDNTLTTIDVPGSHEGMFEEPNVHVLIEQLEKVLNET